MRKVDDPEAEVAADPEAESDEPVVIEPEYGDPVGVRFFAAAVAHMAARHGELMLPAPEAARFRAALAEAERAWREGVARQRRERPGPEAGGGG